MRVPVLEALPWDSAWLGLSVARLVAEPATTAAAVAAAVAQSQARGVRLLYLVLPAGSPAAAEIDGAWPADVRLTYQWTAAPVPAPAGGSLLQLARLTEATPALRELAWQSGEYSRFRRDARIPPAAREALYAEWLARALGHDIVWGAWMADELVGMLAFEGGPNLARIELVAVAPTAQRCGVGQALVQAARHETHRRGLATLQVVTQQANAPARQLYERSGFRQIDARDVYHVWQ